MRHLTIALACGALLLAPGCGDDGEDTSRTEPAATTTVPQEEEAPDTSTSEAPASTQTETTPPATDPSSGGSPAPSKPAPDSPESDRKPDPGSPADRFEEFCDENPGACG